MNKLEEHDIGYTSIEHDSEYASRISKCNTLDELKELIDEYELIAGEAKDKVDVWTDQDFKEFKTAIWHERRKEFMGEEDAERFALVLMPDPMFTITMFKLQLNVGFGLVFRRFIDTGIGKVVNGRLEFHIESSDVPNSF